MPTMGNWHPYLYTKRMVNTPNCKYNTQISKGYLPEQPLPTTCIMRRLESWARWKCASKIGFYSQIFDLFNLPRPSFLSDTVHQPKNNTLKENSNGNHTLYGNDDVEYRPVHFEWRQVQETVRYCGEEKSEIYKDEAFRNLKTDL